MKAIMLAAGIGSRLAPSDENLLPKCLLKFEGKSLLSRHIQTLKSVGIEELTIVMGYFALQIRMDAGFYKQLPSNHEFIHTYFHI